MTDLLPPSLIIIGIGTEHRGDDAAGLAVARALREIEFPSFVKVREFDGSGPDLLHMWQGMDVVHLVDAVSAGAEPGTIFTLDLHREHLPRSWTTSTHNLGIPETVNLARILDCLPPTIILYAIQGQSFDLGQELSPFVKASVRKVTALIELEVLSLLSQPSMTARH